MNETFRALAREAALGAEHMAFGATVLGRANYAQHAYYSQAFFSLSVGFERACKLALLVDHAIDNGGRFPREKAVRSYGHDLAQLLMSVEEAATRRGFDAQIPATQVHRDIISILSNFAKNVTRYYNVDVLVGKSTVGPSDDPVVTWYRKVTEPILAVRYTGRRRDRDIANAQIIEELMGPFSRVHHESETGEQIDSLYAGANATSMAKVAKPWERMHVLQIARFVGNVVSDLGFVAQTEGVDDVPYLSEFFAIFRNDDAYFRSRKIWSIYP
ncbi:MAG: hypothetical protein WBR33_19460 [Pseudonocardiaceae bacterium]